jgi:hypothetical protein
LTDVGTITTGAVGIAGITYAGWNRWLSLKHDRTLADLAAVRAVVEDGAVHLHRVAYALDPVKLDPQSNARTASAALGPLGEKYDEVSERMKVRLGPEHEITRKYVGAGEAALDATRAVQRVAVLHVPRLEKGGLAAKQTMKLLEQDEAALVNARARFDEHRREFIDAAQGRPERVCRRADPSAEAASCPEST